MLAPCLQDAIPETERETKKETKYMPPISQDLFNEYAKIRKAKNQSPLTERMFNAIVKESQLAGITVEQAIEECIVRSWITFKADWYSKPSKAQSREQDLQWFLGNQAPKEIEVK